MFRGRGGATAGGLHKDDLKLNKRGKIVSVKKSNAAKRSFAQNSALRAQSKAVKQASAELRAQGNGSPSFLQIRQRANQILGK